MLRGERGRVLGPALDDRAHELGVLLDRALADLGAVRLRLEPEADLRAELAREVPEQRVLRRAGDGRVEPAPR